MFKCEVCKDKRHVFEDSAWKKCPKCYRAAEAEHRLSKLPAHLRDKGLASVDFPNIEILKKVVERISKNEFPKKYVILAGKRPKEEVIAATIRDVSLSGKSCDRVSLQHCLDLYFNEKEDWRKILEGAPDVLFVQLGTEILNSASTPVLRELFSERMWRGAYTMVSSDTTIKVMKTDKRFPTELVDFLSGPDFKEVIS